MPAPPLLNDPGMTMQNERGFSLVEVLLVVVVIGVLAGIAIAQYASYRSRSFDSRVASVVRHVATGEEAYYSNHLNYAADADNIPGVNLDDVAVTITAGNSGSLATSFRVEGSHPEARLTYTWTSDPEPGEPHLIESQKGA
jgi:prepilin-type N-terminal cleavage/methylation domain-containing protein